MKLQVLMSTYNGEKYLCEQMDSILAQTLFQDSDWDTELVIRDDGSTDQTCQMLENYQRQFSKITYYSGKNLGVIASFFDLIRNTPDDVDYVAFADQDDVWHNDKLESAIRSLSVEDSGKPLLYCNRVQLVDENLDPVPGVFFSDQVRPSFGNALVENICTGCTAVLNREMIRLMKSCIPSFTAMHDWWFYLLASCYGEVIYDPVPHMYYRQHSDNAVGVRKNYFSEFVARAKRFKKNRYQISRQVKALMDFSKACGYPLDSVKKEWMVQILASRKSLGARFRMVQNKEIYRQRKMDDIIFRIIFLTGTV